MPKVLLTGGSGFIAAHVLELLLSRGHEVITTVRSEEKAAKIRDAHPGAKLTVALVPDIAQPNAFDAVLQTPGIDYVQHTASPFHYKWKDAKTELLDPAILGTTSILQGIKKFAPTVKRVVITSSFAAMLDVSLQGPKKVWSEADWNPSTYEDGLTGPPAVSYRVSKVLAEKAAWDFVANEKPNFDVATICPPLVFGPVVHHLNSLAAINTSNERFVALCDGKWRDGGIPATGVFLWVDVRDVARAHVEAMERAAAGGKRFFTTAGTYSNDEIAAHARAKFSGSSSAIADKLPPAEGGKSEGGYPAEGVYGYDHSRATEELGIGKWITLEKSVEDTIQSLLAVKG